MKLDDENSLRILNEPNLSLDSNNDLQSPTIDFGSVTTSSPRKASVQMSNPKKPSKGAGRRNLRDKHAERNLKFIILIARSLRGKIPEFHSLIEEHRPEVVCVTETHLDSTIPTYEIFPDYFNVYWKDRNLDGGGVAIAVKNNLESLPCLNIDSEAEIVWS